MTPIEEVVLWTRIVIDAGYPAPWLVPYLMSEFRLSYEDGLEVALAAQLKQHRRPLIE